jgi:hypothetical protein
MTHVLAERQTSLTVTSISPESEEMVKSHCPNCCSYLAIHMPDPDSPDRMLAICSGCDIWYYIEVAPDGESAVMVRLPDVTTNWSSMAG